MNTIMLALALRLIGRKLRFGRMLGGALFGAGAAWAARISGSRNAALWLPVAAGMTLIAGCGHSAMQLACGSAVLFCAGGLLGGVVLAVHGASGSYAAAYGVCAAAAVWLAAAVLGRKRRHGRVEVECRIRGQTIRFDAMIDTGNTLRDYLTKRPVIVVPQERARRMAEELPVRLIFADTAGGRQMMRLIVPDEIVLIDGGGRKTVFAALALAPALHARSPALVPAALAGDG